MKTRNRRAALIVLLAALTPAASCAPPRAQPTVQPRPTTKPCRLFEQPTSRAIPARADLSAIKPLHQYVAVTGVEPFGHHFALWYHKMAPTMLSLRVRRVDGKLSIASAGESWGGIAVAPREIPPLPLRVRGLAREVQADLCSRCAAVCKAKIGYFGAHRVVSVTSFIAHHHRGAHKLFGLHTFASLKMDASLSRISSSVSPRASHRLFSLPAQAQWVLAPAKGTQPLLSRTAIGALSAQIVDATRRFDAGATPPALASLVPPDGPLVPACVTPQLYVMLGFSGRPLPSSGARSIRRYYRAVFNLRDAVFAAGATSEGSIGLGKDRYKVTMRLAPRAALSAAPRKTKADYEGTLTVKIQAARGPAWRRSYEVRGRVELDGKTAVFPRGLRTPGTACRTPTCANARGHLPAAPPFRGLHFEMGKGMGLELGPRRGCGS